MNINLPSINIDGLIIIFTTFFSRKDSNNPVNEHRPFLPHLFNNLIQRHTSTLIQIYRLEQILLQRYFQPICRHLSLNFQQFIFYVNYLMGFQALKDELFRFLLIFDRNRDEIRITARHWCLLWELSRDYTLCFDNFLMQCVFEHECCFGYALWLAKRGNFAFVHGVISIVVGHYHWGQFRAYSLIAVIWLIFFRGDRVWAWCK